MKPSPEKIVRKVQERRTITVQTWKLRSNEHIVQVFIGNVEIRRFNLPSAILAKEKIEKLQELFTDNRRCSVELSVTWSKAGE